MIINDAVPCRRKGSFQVFFTNKEYKYFFIDVQMKPNGTYTVSAASSFFEKAVRCPKKLYVGLNEERLAKLCKKYVKRFLRLGFVANGSYDKQFEYLLDDILRRPFRRGTYI